MKSFWLFIILIIFKSSIGAQDQNAINDFIIGANTTEDVEFQKNKLYFLSSNSNNLPILEQLEFRTETNEFKLAQQEYLLRISPNSFQKINAQRQYQETVCDQAKMEMETVWSASIKQRYNLLIEYNYSLEILAIMRKQEVLFRDRVTLLKRSVVLPGFDIMDLIIAEDEALENLRDLLDLETAIANCSNLIKDLSASDLILPIPNSQLLTIEALKINLKRIENPKIGDHPYLRELSSLMYSKKLEYEWELAERKFSIGYIQTKFTANPQDNFAEKFSIGIGFDIPFKSASRLDLNDLEIEIQQAESNFKLARKDLFNRKDQLANKLQNLITKFELIQDQLQNSQSEYALKEYSKIAEVSPQAILKLRENTLKKELLLKELQLQVMQNYIDYLEISGILIQLPLRNYLSKSLELL